MRTRGESTVERTPGRFAAEERGGSREVLAGLSLKGWGFFNEREGWCLVNRIVYVCIYRTKKAMFGVWISKKTGVIFIVYHVVRSVYLILSSQDLSIVLILMDFIVPTNQRAPRGKFPPSRQCTGRSMSLSTDLVPRREGWTFAPILCLCSSCLRLRVKVQIIIYSMLLPACVTNIPE
ncbi:hypothetical protein ACFX15_022916 [Malus domestica]